METSINLDLDDLMGPEDEFDDLPALTRLPGLDDDDDQENFLNTSGQRNEGLLDTLLDPVGGEEGDAPAAKRMVNRKPLPKLDATRLTGERGLPILVKHFEKVKFKGKGHEVSDLDRLMRVMEHWAHRLFPKMPFDDVIERIEKLGSKKPVQTCIRKIRLDMPLLDEDFVTRGGEDVIEGENTDAQPAADLGDDFPSPSFPGTQQPPSSMPKVSMTDEQREQIERNKRLAKERRLNKQKEAPSSQQSSASQSGGLNESELNDLFGTGKAKTKARVEVDDGIDSDEAEMEREMWESQVTGGKKEDKKASQHGAAPEQVEVDHDEEEMENEMLNQMTQPVPTQSQMGRSQEKPKVTKKSKGVIEDESDDEEIKAVESPEEAPKGARRSKRVIEDDSDDEVMEVLKDSQAERSQEMPSKVAKKRRVIDDDDDESEDEMEIEDSNKMTKLLSPKTGSQKRIVNDDDDDDDKEGDEVKKAPKIAEVEFDICNQMTEPALSQMPTNSNTLLTSQEASNSNNLNQDTNDDDAGETGSEICNQMTEKVATQNVNDSQEGDQSYTVLKSKRSVINDDDDGEDDEDETEIDPDVCNQDTEPVIVGNSQDTV